MILGHSYVHLYSKHQVVHISCFGESSMFVGFEMECWEEVNYLCQLLWLLKHIVSLSMIFVHR